MSELEAARIFAEEASAFAAAFPWLPPVRLVIRTRHYRARTAARDLAWYEIDRGEVCLLRAALARSAGSVRGILRHELGHAADLDVRKRGAEARADRLAWIATGAPVRYTADGVQHATHGEAERPPSLPR